MTKTLKKLRLKTAMVLALLIAVMIPVQTGAIVLPEMTAAENQISGTQGGAIDAQEEETKPAKILAEVTEDRDEYTKHFRMDDGSFMAVQYEYPVHYQDKNGEWVDYDNSMKEVETQPATDTPTEPEKPASSTEPAPSATEKHTASAASIDASAATAAVSETEAASIEATEAETETATDAAEPASLNFDENTEYKNKKSDLDIRLSKKAKKNNMVKIKGDGYQVSWGFAGVNKSRVEFISNDEKLEGNDKFLVRKNLVQEALYKNAFPNVDLQYLVTPVGVKENIILKNKEAQTEFKIEYKMKGLTAVQKNNYMIELQNEQGETVYEITSPFMTDANGAESNAMSLTIISQKNYKLVLKIAAESEWLQDNARVYPVIMDPEIKVGNTPSTTQTAIISASLPDQVLHQSTYFFVGNSDGQYGSTKALVKMNSLPTLEETDRVVSARLQLTPMSPADAMIIRAYNVMSQWSNSTATWNNTTYDNTAAIDYMKLENDQTDPAELDITKTVKQWYSGDLANNGIVLDTPNSTALGHFGGYNCYLPDKKPFFYVMYKSFCGTEPELGYHTHEIGSKGIASVCDYTGSMSLRQNIFTGTGARMPVAIDITYNSLLCNTVFGNGSPCGYGWQFSFNRYIKEASVNLQAAGYEYVYTDEDGTEHYFELSEDSSTEWKDESGLGLTLTLGIDHILITDLSGITAKYQLPEDGGKILQETDEYNNTIAYTYNTEGNLTTIKDGVGRVYTLTYSVNSDSGKKRVSQITAPDGKKVLFTYSAASRDRLSTLSYQDVSSNTYESVTYVYNQTTNKINRVISSDNSEIRYIFNSKGQVTRITEYGTDLTTGNYLNINYSNDNTTTFTDRKGRSETYTFDHNGNTVTKLNANGYIENSSSGQMAIKAGAESYTKNYVVASNAPIPQFFSTAHGKIGRTTSSGGTVTFDNSATLVNGEAVQYFGDKSIKVTNSTTSQFYTMAKQTINTADLAGEDVTFSAYIKTGALTNMHLAEQSGARLVLKFLDSSNTVLAEQCSVAIPGDSKWQRISVTAKAPNNLAKIEIAAALYNAQGSAWFNCLQLEKGDCMNDYNAISNSDFSGLDSWQGPYTVNGYPEIKNSLRQDMTVNKSNIAFSISGKAYANSAPIYDDRRFGIRLFITYNDNTTEEHYQEFNAATAEEQYIGLYVIPKKPNEVIKKIAFEFIYDYNINKMKPLNAMLNFEYGITGANSSEVVSESSESTEGETQEDEEFSTEPYNGSAYTYDQYGNVLSSAIGTVIPVEDGEDSIDTSKPHIIKNTTYDTTGNYVVSESDSCGNAISYNVDTTNGSINSVTDANNNSTSYTYDAAENLLSVSSGNASNSYVYANNKLSALSHNGFRYNFSYNSYGNVVSTKIGNSPLITHTYEGNNGNLVQSTFGNGDDTLYTYDKFDRIIKISNSDETLVEYFYNKKNQVTKILDYASGLTTEYEYSISGNCLSRSTYSSDLSASYYEFETTNENGDKVLTTVVEGVTKTVTTSLNDEDNSSVINNDNWNLSQTVDSLERKTQKKTVLPESTQFTEEYTYVNGVQGSQTTELVETITQKFGDTVLVTYGYTYDANGNIKSVLENGAEKYVYTYDSLNQLKSVTDKVQNKYYLYSYDNSGNIRSVNVQRWDPIYGYPEGNPNADTYYYKDENWKDILTAFNSFTITYDEIGNPLKYRNGMVMTWENGRQLKSLTQSGNSISYTYDINGMRTQKNSGNTVTRYYYDEQQKLSSMVIGSRRLMFYYDQDGAVHSVSDGENRYYYVKNLQGDITKLVSVSGTIVANYVYDAFGKMVSVKDSSGNNITDQSHIANVNPLRYRGYVYDTDTGLYYLHSRYYDPETGRFINADIYVDTDSETLGTNMFTYCLNNAINRVDPEGTWSKVIGQLYKRTYSKYNGRHVNDKFVVPLTNYIETKNGGTITWTKNKSYNISVSLTISMSGKKLAAALGVKYSYTLEHSSSYSFKVKKNKGKYARIVAKIDATKYQVKETAYWKTDYYNSWGWWDYYVKTKYTSNSRNIGYIYLPKPKTLSIGLQYTNRK